MRRILVVAPHPDDEVIGCGGSIVKYAREGHEVTVLTLGARLGSGLENDLTAADYAAESEAALRTLGVGHHVELELPARDIQINRDLLLRLAEIFRGCRPDVVYLPHGEESDAEHRQANEMAQEALWMAQSIYFEDRGPPMPPPRLVLAYEVWTPMTRFQYVEDISDVIDIKVEAMRCYRSQLRHGAWDDAIRGLATYRGITTRGRGHAEVFQVLQTSLGPSSRAPSDTGGTSTP